MIMTHPILEDFPDSKFIRECEHSGWPEYFDGQFWMNERDTCQHCLEQRLAEDKPPQWAEEQYSMGIYAGRYCDKCWDESGYVKDGPSAFDPGYAGEHYGEDDY